MSEAYLRAVSKLDKRVGTTQRLLLKAIALDADYQGCSSPGNECLARRTEISERHVKRLISELEAMRLIQIVQVGNGKGHPSIIRLLFPPALLTEDPLAGVPDSPLHPEERLELDGLTREFLTLFQELDANKQQTLLNLAKMIKSADEPRIIGGKD